MDKPLVEASSFDAVLPLPLYKRVFIGTLVMPDSTRLSIYLGADEDTAHQLREQALSADEELLTNTHDRARFGEGSYEDWYAKGRSPFSLVDDVGNLAAFIWFGAEMPPKECAQGVESVLWDTVAFRSYPPYRGRGMMTPLACFVIETYERLMPGHHLWLAARTENIPALGLYGKLGFQVCGYGEDGTRTYMIRS